MLRLQNCVSILFTHRFVCQQHPFVLACFLFFFFFCKSVSSRIGVLNIRLFFDFHRPRIVVLSGSVCVCNRLDFTGILTLLQQCLELLRYCCAPTRSQHFPTNFSFLNLFTVLFFLNQPIMFPCSSKPSRSRYYVCLQLYNPPQVHLSHSFLPHYVSHIVAVFVTFINFLLRSLV